MPTAYLVTRSWEGPILNPSTNLRGACESLSIIMCETCCVLHVPSNARVQRYALGPVKVKDEPIPRQPRCARCGCEVEV